MSFGFRAVKEAWEGERRTLQDVELIEVSIVQSWPAYTDTTVALRNRQQAGSVAVLRHWLETTR